MEKELKSCTGILLRAYLTGHSQFSQSADFCQKGWDGLALLGQPSKGHQCSAGFQLFFHTVLLHFSNIYQTIGDLFCPVIFVDFRTVCFKMLSFLECSHQGLVGDGFCDDATNNPDCNYDGGDCCGSNRNISYCNTCLCIDEDQGNILKGIDKKEDTIFPHIVSSPEYFPPLNSLPTLVRKLFKFSLHKRKNNAETI
jgi:hypothetical protein